MSMRTSHSTKRKYQCRRRWKREQPLREFMLRQTREADLGLFARLANTGPLQGPEAVPMRILLPAYVTSELKTAFQIGFTIFIPF